ncbi:MAG: hypothetical protein AAGM22_33215 [Acidobacteriota bacterium]
MESTLDLGAGTLRLSFDDATSLEAFLQDAVAQRAFMVALAVAPKPLETYGVDATGGDVQFSFEARVVQLFPGGDGGTRAAFALETWTEDQQAALDVALAGEAPSAAGKGRAARVGDESESRGASPIFRLQQMDPGARARLAAKADRTERRLLRRDNTPAVLMNLLSNPRVGADDVLAIIKSPTANTSILQRIAEDRRWMQNTEVKTALVRQPKTPSQLAIKMLDTLRTEDLRQMAKMGSLREIVRRAAFRVYQQRQRR